MGLRELRESAGFTQAGLAEALDVDQSAVSYWENGKHKPHSKYLRKLAKLYGVTVDELLAGEEVQ